MARYPIFEITPEMQIVRKQDRQNLKGFLTKFWVNHPQLGESLVKLDRPYGKNWTEKVAYEIGKQMQLPVARYELAVLSRAFEENANSPGIITTNYKQDSLSYQESEAVIFQQLGRYPYNFNEETNLSLKIISVYLLIINLLTISTMGWSVEYLQTFSTHQLW